MKPTYQNYLGLLLIIIALFPFSIKAEDLKSLSQQIQKRYEATQTSRFELNQKTYVQVLEKDIYKKAKATFKKPGKFILEYQDQNGRLYMSDGKKLWIYQKGDRQVQSYPLNDDNIPAEALSFLGGLANLEQDFAVEIPEDKKQKTFKLNPQLKWVELSPLKKQSQIAWILLGVNPETFYTQELYLYTDSQNLSHYTLQNREVNF
ncbi:MAG: outer membrane lipoprotein carrier protein LolA, partial [Deltaproteobacteria bacterium]|nr:outer membrane lipoprotein carrier protein LolA [Deltaproteobacteria bacterium]